MIGELSKVSYPVSNDIFNDELKNDSKLIIGYVGRLSQEKGPFYLLQALTQLNDINYECIIVGDGPLMEDLKYFSKVNNLFEKVSFIGYHPEPINLMSMMDIVVVPSLNETFGITIIESFALKKIVIASDIGGIKEIVQNGINGYLFTPKSTNQLSELIRNIQTGKINTSKIGKNAMNFALNNFTSEIMANKTYDFLLNNCDK
jgi:glycosyltransferase involved in cell wall biosynthesis